MKTSDPQLTTTPTSDAALTEAQLADVVGGATYTINLINRTPPNAGIFQRPPTGPDQQTRDWVLRQWFSKP
ncbi:hypothetical protein MIZ03_0406 [Rhodoferax lithotrophicus]|uniref:Uncharacterized protein n=1 Tax=Rhodoferax lithotrophicus TaxID=2798804 RepID=A0ABN6D0Q4_9BURK|nr:hypothetical protein [Rhodoferax sp. MIZ03]BCO25545.1 hypothetical protein MIZ03_0406 [Rhodoferax sp. MIZ03]